RRRRRAADVRLDHRPGASELDLQRLGRVHAGDRSAGAGRRAPGRTAPCARRVLVGCRERKAMVIVQINYRRPEMDKAAWEARYTDDRAAQFLNVAGLQWKIWLDGSEER